MSSNTTNLTLYKSNPVTDGTNVFNINTILNANWDKIDTVIGLLSSLNTTAKASLVLAINEVLSNEGALSSLTTTAKSNLVAAINELNSNKEPIISTKNTAFNQNFETSTSNIKMNGTVSVGSSANVARADHVHASDTTKANVASPAFTGTPQSTTAAADTNTMQIATTAYVVGQASAIPPVMDGVATIGVSKKYSREDHIHASDTTKANASDLATTNANVVANTANIATNTASFSDLTKIPGVIDDTGSVNIYVITLSNAPTAYAKYQTFRFIAKTSNTGESTLNVNGLGAKSLVKDVNVPLVTGDILVGQIVTAIYDGTNFQIVPDFSNQLANKALKPSTFSITASNGYFKDPTTGIITQWGCNGVNSSGTIITLPVAFPTNGVSFVATLANTTQLSGITFNVNKINLSQFEIWSSNATSYYFYWIAIGY